MHGYNEIETSQAISLSAQIASTASGSETLRFQLNLTGSTLAPGGRLLFYQLSRAMRSDTLKSSLTLQSITSELASMTPCEGRSRPTRAKEQVNEPPPARTAFERVSQIRQAWRGVCVRSARTSWKHRSTKTEQARKEATRKRRYAPRQET